MLLPGRTRPRFIDGSWLDCNLRLARGDGIQISFASEGGSHTPTPDLSIEVDDIDAALERMKSAGFTIEYGPVDEPWGVRRFYVRDPFGKLINILAHV